MFAGTPYASAPYAAPGLASQSRPACHDLDTTDLLTSGLSWLTTRLRTNASQPATYVTAGGDQIEIRATLGKKPLRLSDGLGGTLLEWTDLDLLIPASDLVLNGEPVTPSRGDLVYVSVGGKLQAFEARPYDANEPVWRWSDPGQTMLRVHLKLAEETDC